MGYVDTVRALVTYYFSDTEGAESKVALSSYLGVLPFLNPQQYEQVTANYMVYKCVLLLLERMDYLWNYCWCINPLTIHDCKFIKQKLKSSQCWKEKA